MPSPRRRSPADQTTPAARPTLLMPSIRSVAARDRIELTGVPSSMPAEKAWDWLTAQDTLEQGHAEVLPSFYQRAWPQWTQEKVAARYRATVDRAREEFLEQLFPGQERRPDGDD